MSIFSNSQQLIQNKFGKYFLMKTTTWRIQGQGPIKHFMVKRDTLKKVFFSENLTALTTFETSPTQHIFQSIALWADAISQNVRL